MFCIAIRDEQDAAQVYVRERLQFEMRAVELTRSECVGIRVLQVYVIDTVGWSIHSPPSVIFGYFICFPIRVVASWDLVKPMS